MSIRAILYEPELIEALQQDLGQAKGFSFALALITPSGLDLLKNEIQKCLRRGGLGRILAGTDLPTHPDVFESLLELQAVFPESFTLRRSQSLEKRFFHPKLYLCSGKSGRGSAIVGSANLTNGGLQRNHEACVWTNEKTVVSALEQFFDEQFCGAYSRAVSAKWLVAYKKLWAERDKLERKLREVRTRVRNLKVVDRGRNLPKRIKGEKFVFTGGVDEWPRERRLYPTVRRLGGVVGTKASALTDGAWLVHGISPNKGDNTVKIRVANQRGVPIIDEDEFLLVLNAAVRSSRRT